MSQSVVLQSDDSLPNNASTTRTTMTTTTSTARLHPALTSTSSRPEAEPSLSIRSSPPNSPNGPVESHTNGNITNAKSIDPSDLSDEQLREEFTRQQEQIRRLEQQVQAQEKECLQLKQENEKVRHELEQYIEKEKGMKQQLSGQNHETSGECSSRTTDQQQHTTHADKSLHQVLLDPSVNKVFHNMRREVEDARIRVADIQTEVTAWKLDPDSSTGQRLITKCQQLYQENEELNRMITTGREAKQAGQLALQKNFAEEVRKSQSEIDHFLSELGDDFDGMQSTIAGLQSGLDQLKSQLLSFQVNMFNKKDETNGADEKTTSADPDIDSAKRLRTESGDETQNSSTV